MPTAFPAGYDDFPNPTGDLSQNASPTLSARIANLNDAVEALQHRVGKTGETDVASLEARAGGLGAALSSILAGKGASLIGVQDAASLLAASTVEAALAELAMRMPPTYIVPEVYGCIGDGVADDTVAMQAAAQAAAGKTLRLTPGRTYLLNSGGMRVKSNTIIYAYGATIKRGAGTNRFITLDTDGVTGGYDAVTDVSILGGIWDGRYPTINTSLTCFGICHSRRIRIRDCYMKNTALSHYIEINSSTDVVVSGCTFSGGAEQADDSMEAIQIDGAIDAATFSGGAPYDNTFCSNITIANNTFTQCGTGVGTHSTVSGFVHSNIRIIGNQFTLPYYCGVRATNWENAVISGNVFYGGLHAVRAFADVATIVRGLTITGNVMQAIGNTAKGALGDGHAIYLSGNSSGTEQVQDWTIGNNVIRDCNQSKSGSGIKVNYCPNGTIIGNMIDGVAATGISVFGNGGIIVNSNRAQNCAAFGISAASLNLLSVTNNMVDTIDYSNVTKGVFAGNVVVTASGITFSGTNTNTSRINNLQGTVFA